MEPCIGQDDHLLVKLRNQRVKIRVVDVRRGAVSGTDQAPLVQDNTELAAADPPLMALAFFANLRWATPFAHRMDQRNPICVYNAQHRWGRQKRVVHAVWVLKSHAKRVRSGTCGNKGR